jgi:hypothetical protein
MSLNQHWLDANGNPAGGVNQDVGFTISWQNGPLGTGENWVAANGAFVENVLNACVQRLEFYQSSKFACSDNAAALDHINEAIRYLNRRTAVREARGVEGTHEL